MHACRGAKESEWQVKRARCFFGQKDDHGPFNGNPKQLSGQDVGKEFGLNDGDLGQRIFLQLFVRFGSSGKGVAETEAVGDHPKPRSVRHNDRRLIG